MPVSEQPPHHPAARWSLTDAVKALREIINLIRDVSSLAGDVTHVLRKTKARRIAKEIAHISFPRDGMRQPLHRIASGEFTDIDFADLERQLVATTPDVERALSNLHHYQEVIRERLGLELSRRFNDLWYKPDKSWIRLQSKDLIDAWQTGCRNRIYLSQASQAILLSINELDHDLIEIHDTIIGALKNRDILN